MPSKTLWHLYTATVFASHCWGGRRGDLVALRGVCVGADNRRVVWIDIFAVRRGHKFRVPARPTRTCPITPGVSVSQTPCTRVAASWAGRAPKLMQRSCHHSEIRRLCSSPRQLRFYVKGLMYFIIISILKIEIEDYSNDMGSTGGGGGGGGRCWEK